MEVTVTSYNIPMQPHQKGNRAGYPGILRFFNRPWKIVLAVVLAALAAAELIMLNTGGTDFEVLGLVLVGSTAIGLILAWKVSGYIGLDYFLLSWLGTPWEGAQVEQGRSSEQLSGVPAK